MFLTVDVHDTDAHDAGDEDQGEASSEVVHKQQPVDSGLRTQCNHGGELKMRPWEKTLF